MKHLLTFQGTVLLSDGMDGHAKVFSHLRSSSEKVLNAPPPEDWEILRRQEV
jgi:hypothetical protein